MTQLLTEEDIIDRIKSKTEHPDFDYKDDIDLSGDKEHKAEITKDVVAMANYGGGLIVGGVPESTTGYVLKGMPEASLRVFDSTALNDFVKNYCGPPINTTTRKIEIDGNVYGVVIVPGFATQPHIITKDYPEVLRTGDILVRSASNNSVRAGPEDLRRLIDRAVSLKQQALKDMLQAALPGSHPLLIGGTSVLPEAVQPPFDRSKYSDRYKGFRIVAMAPLGSDMSVQLPHLRPAVDQALVLDLAGRVHFPPLPLSATAENRLPVGIVFENEEEYWPRLTFLFLGANGQVFCADTLWEDTRWAADSLGSVSVFSTISTLYSALIFARLYYPALDYQGKVQVRFSQESSVPRALQMDSKHFWPFPERYYNDMATPVAIERIVSANANLDELETLAVDMMIEFFWYFHYDLDQDAATKHLEHVKKTEVAVPRGLRSEPEDPKQSN